MRVEGLRVDAFGKLKGFDTGPEALGPLVVVLGPNEAGKSTLFTFLTTALYGFQPASRDRNPHVPWGGDRAGGSVRLRLEGDRCAAVERVLRSSPTGTLTVDGRSKDLRNQAIPWVEHVPRTVFRQVFAITLSELASLDQETWARIQDRVLGSMGASDLLPARSVAEELEKEAGEIWRPNRRGNQRLRDLQAAIRKLRGRRADAIDRDARIRGLVEEREGVVMRLREARAERQRDKIVVERVQELLPIKRQLDRIEELREAGGSRRELRDLPDDLRGALRALETERERIDDEVASLEADMAAPRATVDSYDEEARHLVSCREQVAPFLSRAAAVEGDRVRASELRTEIDELDRRLRSTAEHLLTGPCDPAAQDAVGRVSIDLLRDRIDRAERLRRARLSAAGAGSESAGSMASAPLPLSPTGVAAAAVVGAGLVGWTLAGGPAWSAVVGAALLGIGVTLEVVRRAALRDPTEDGDAREVERLEDEIRTLLDSVAVRPEYLRPPGPGLVSSLERLQEVIREGRDRRRMLASTADAITVVDDLADRVAEAVGEPGPERVSDFAARMDHRLREAERARVAAEGSEHELERMARNRQRLDEARDRNAVKLDRLRGAIDAVAGGAADDAVAIVQRRLEAHTNADRVRDDLVRTHPNLSEIEERIRDHEHRGVDWTVDEGDLARRKVRVENLEGQIEEAVGRAEALDRDVAHLRDQETVDTVDSEILSLQEDETRLVTERDRKWVLAHLLREADRRFREEHQPDLLLRASGYLERLTAGRYDKLIVDEHADADLFHLMGPGLPAPIPLAHPVSTGTLEQAYLSLRLAIVDHLDQGRERLPIFIDEALVNWDAERRERGLEVLAELSGDRQVFAFTCHARIARSLEERGGRVVELEL